MRIRALVQARLNSSRLPNKVLEKIGEKTLIEHIAGRLGLLSGAGVELCFAVADEPDPALRDFLSEKGLVFYAGAEQNVLQRYCDAAADLTDSDYVIRATADNPFPDQEQLGRLVSYVRRNPIDYGYTAHLPLGMGTEIIRVNALRSVMIRSVPLVTGGESGLQPHHTEHVTPYIRENAHLYDIYPQPLDETVSDEDAKLRVAGIRLTVDEPADLDVARRVFTHFNRLGKPAFTAVDVIQLKKNNPEMLAGNEQVEQRDAQSVDARTLKK